MLIHTYMYRLNNVNTYMCMHIYLMCICAWLHRETCNCIFKQINAYVYTHGHAISLRIWSIFFPESFLSLIFPSLFYIHFLVYFLKDPSTLSVLVIDSCTVAKFFLYLLPSTCSQGKMHTILA